MFLAPLISVPAGFSIIILIAGRAEDTIREAFNPGRTIRLGPALCTCAQLTSGSVRLPVTHRPAASVRGHVAVHLEACGVMHRKHRVYTVLAVTAGVQVAAVPGP